MKKWELRYLHDKAVRDALFEMAGKEIPKDEPYGVIYHTKDNICHFDGRLFFTILERIGHDATSFNTCKCHKNYHSLEY